jgi:hypothetical protein
VLGSAVHASTAVYDQSAIDSKGVTIEEAAGAAVDVIWHPSEDVEWDEEAPSEVESIALALHGKYCREIAPRQDYAAVEIKCETLEITDLGIALTGTTDRVRRTPDGYGVTDIKTGKAAVAADGTVKTSGFGFQLGVYELLAQHASGLDITGPAQIVGLNAAKTTVAQRVGVGEITQAREALLGEPDSPGVLEVVSRMIHSGAFPGNPRSTLCSGKYCPIFNRCKFRK